MARKKHAFHGGSWKVALADFMTAMFCLFLVLWLVGLSPEQKEGLASYFNNYSVLKPNPGTNAVIQMTGSGGTAKINEGKRVYQKVSEKDLEKIEKNIKEQFKETPETLKNHIIFEKTDEGLRINLIDNQGSSMFELGNKNLTPKGEDIIKKVAKEISNYYIPMVIEGHTDALNYTGQTYTNWELSTERALAAKQALVKDGLPLDNIENITGFADTKPLIKENRYDSRNRRISILIRK